MLFSTCIRAHFTVRQIYVRCTVKLSEDLSSYHTLRVVSSSISSCFHSANTLLACLL